MVPPAADAGGPEPAVENVHQDERAVTVTPLPEPVQQPVVTEDVSALARKLGWLQVQVDYLRRVRMEHDDGSRVSRNRYLKAFKEWANRFEVAR